MLAGEFEAHAGRLENAHERYSDLAGLLSAVRIDLPLKAGNLLLSALDTGVIFGLDGPGPEWDLRRAVSVDEMEFADHQERERYRNQLVIDSWYACIRWCLAPGYARFFEAG